MSDNIQLQDSWKNRLTAEFAQPYMQQLKGFLLKRKEAGARVYPRGQNIFNALNTTDFDNVKVVILGQDPYHGPGQAHGLSFSVPEGVPHPPSLQNIFKELTTDVGKTIPKSGNLQSWAEQGVLLLNSVLTVEEGQAAAHAGKGWEQFTDKVIHLLNDEREHVVFILWGSYAQAKGKFIDRRKHLVIESPHPSPLSAHRGFFGSKPFSKANAYLTQHGLLPINW